MGVSDMLSLLEEAGLLRNVQHDQMGASGYKRLAVDISVLIHARLPLHAYLIDNLSAETAVGFAGELADDIILLLRWWDKVIVVFDGRRMKEKRVNARRSAKVAEAKAQLASNTISEEERRACREIVVGSLATDVVPYLIHLLRSLAELRYGDRLTYIVAPYEADVQLTALVRQDRADAVFTRDSDLIIGGHGLVIFADSIPTAAGKRRSWRQGCSRAFVPAASNDEPDTTRATATAEGTTTHTLATCFKRHGVSFLQLAAYFAGNDYAKIDGLALRGAIAIASKLETMTVPAFVNQYLAEKLGEATAELRQQTETALYAVAHTSATFFHTQPVFTVACGLGSYKVPPHLFWGMAVTCNWPDHYFEDLTPPQWKLFSQGYYTLRAEAPVQCPIFGDEPVRQKMLSVAGARLIARRDARDTANFAAAAAAAPSAAVAKGFLGQRGMTQTGTAADIRQRAALHGQDAAARGPRFQDVPQDKVKIAAELEKTTKAFNAMKQAATAYPPRDERPFALDDSLTRDYYRYRGVETLKQDLAIARSGRLSGPLTWFVTRSGSSPAEVKEVVIFGTVGASFKGHSYSVAAYLTVIGFEIVGITQVLCLLPHGAGVDIGAGKEKVVAGETDACQNQNACTHGRFLLDQIRLYGLPAGSTDDKRQWGLQSGGYDGSACCAADFYAMCTSASGASTTPSPELSPGAVDSVRRSMKLLVEAVEEGQPPEGGLESKRTCVSKGFMRD